MLKINKAQITGPTGRGVDLKRKKKGQNIRYCNSSFCLSSWNTEWRLTVTFCIPHDTKETNPNWHF